MMKVKRTDKGNPVVEETTEGMESCQHWVNTGQGPGVNEQLAEPAIQIKEDQLGVGALLRKEIKRQRSARRT